MVRVVGKRGRGTVEEQLDDEARGVEVVRSAAAHMLGVTEAEYVELDEVDRKWLRGFARKVNLSAFGLTKGRWEKLSLPEKLAYRERMQVTERSE